MSEHALRPYDVAVALRLAEVPFASFKRLAKDLGLSGSTAHAAVRRLMDAGLVRMASDGSRPVNRLALLEFLEHGVRYAFPGVLGPVKSGIPTAYAGPALKDQILAEYPVVWPHVGGPAVGPTVNPLLPKAAELPERSPDTYALLSAVDAIRVGRARERVLAMAFLRRRLTVA